MIINNRHNIHVYHQDGNMDDDWEYDGDQWSVMMMMMMMVLMMMMMLMMIIMISDDHQKIDSDMIFVAISSSPLLWDATHCRAVDQTINLEIIRIIIIIMISMVIIL